MKYFTTLLLLCIAHNTQQLPDVCGSQTVFSEEEVGEPLFLTPLINANKIEEARNLSEIHFDEFMGVKIHAGFLTVNETLNSNSYFWFLPAEENYEEAPVVLWLEGGPGASSLITIFSLIGPFDIQSDFSLKKLPTYWSKTHSMLFIDNPVGTGYSFTNEGGQATDETQIGQQLVTALHQFFKMFPELQKNRFYAAGESYGGKFVPAVSYAILKSNPTAEIPINLQGLMIGNGLCDFGLQINYADYLYQLGMLDSNGREQFREMQNQIVDNIAVGNYQNASNLLDVFLLVPDSLYYRLTGFHNRFNFLYEEDPTLPAWMTFMQYIQQAHVRAAIHVGNLTFDDPLVYPSLHEDMMVPVTAWVSELLEHYKILFYSGQTDIMVSYPVTENFFQHLNFSGAEEYKTAPREKWYVDGKLAGYSKEAGKLKEVLVRNAGHTAMYEQPENVYSLISNFTQN